MRILDPRFRYVPSYATDIAKTFRRVRKEIEEGRRMPDGDPAGLLPRQREVQRRLDAQALTHSRASNSAGRDP